MAIGVSVLANACQLLEARDLEYGATYAGSMEVIVSPATESTNSLLMNNPVGWVNLTPFGAWSCRDFDAILLVADSDV